MNSNENRPLVIGLGELLWDVFPDGKRPGGAPANVAFQAQQLGCQGLIVSRVGNDESGRELVAFLRSKGLFTDAIQVDESAPTGGVTVSFNAADQPEYVIHEGVAWDQIECHDELQQIMNRSAAVCFGTLAQRSPISRRSILQAVAATSPACLRVYDVNIRQNYYDIDWVKASLELATIVKLNDEEVDLLAPLLELPGEYDSFAEQLIEAYSLSMVCITRGARGCVVADQTEIVDIPGKPVVVADTVGAGDAFAAGLIFAQLSRASLAKSGEFANAVGGLVASQHGAMPDLKEQFAELIKNLE